MHLGRKRKKRWRPREFVARIKKIPPHRMNVVLLEASLIYVEPSAYESVLEAVKNADSVVADTSFFSPRARLYLKTNWQVFSHNDIWSSLLTVKRQEDYLPDSLKEEFGRVFRNYVSFYEDFFKMFENGRCLITSEMIVGELLGDYYFMKKHFKKLGKTLRFSGSYEGNPVLFYRSIIDNLDSVKAEPISPEDIPGFSAEDLDRLEKRALNQRINNSSKELSDADKQVLLYFILQTQKGDYCVLLTGDKTIAYSAQAYLESRDIFDAPNRIIGYNFSANYDSAYGIFGERVPFVLSVYRNKRGGGSQGQGGESLEELLRPKEQRTRSS